MSGLIYWCRLCHSQTWLQTILMESHFWAAISFFMCSSLASITFSLFSPEKHWFLYWKYWLGWQLLTKKTVNSNLFMSSNLGRSTSFCPVSHPALPTNTSKLQNKELSLNIWKSKKVAIYLADQKLPMSRPVTKVGDRNKNSASICWGLACPAAKGIVGWIYSHLQNVLFTWAK